MKTRINVVIDGKRTTASIHSLLVAKAKNHSIDIQKVADGHCYLNLVNTTVSQMLESLLISEICHAEFLAGIEECRKTL